jgi:uncharacterized protein with beta-barrel porin domain
MVFSKIRKIKVMLGAVLFLGFANYATTAHAADTLLANQISFGNSNSISAASVSGNSISSLTTLALSAGNEFNQAVTRRQNKLHSFSNSVGTSEVFFGKPGDVELQKDAKKVLEVIGKQFGFSNNDGGSAPQFWSNDFSRHGNVNSNEGLHNYNYVLVGYSGGVDVHAGDSWNFGIAGGYTKAKSAFEAMGATATEVAAYQGSLYATFEHDIGSVDSNVSFNKFDNSSARSIIGSAIDNTANSKGKGYQLAWTLSAMGHSNYNKYSLTPITGFTFTKLHRGSMNENGAGFYDLNSSSTDSTSLRPMLGIDIARSYTYQSDMIITPEIYGIYRYETMDASEHTANHLEHFDNTSASSRTNLSRHSMQVGSSVSMKIGERFTSKLQFDSDLQPTSRSYSGIFKVNYSW